MTLTGGKRKANKSLRAWVTFVKKVQKQEKLSYKDAIHRAKQRKDKGEKWMKGGNEMRDESSSSEETANEMEEVGGRRRRRKSRRGGGDGDDMGDMEYNEMGPGDGMEDMEYNEMGPGDDMGEDDEPSSSSPNEDFKMQGGRRRRRTMRRRSRKSRKSRKSRRSRKH